MRMIEADNVQALLPRLSLDSHQFLRRDVITIVRRIGPRVAGTHEGLHLVGSILEESEQHSATFMRISLFPMLTDFPILCLAQHQHRTSSLLPETFAQVLVSRIA